ncbi:hypothetical protein NKR23_g9702 [Pleurostoma richardsiae]|uniref:Uncharacterized protein n=1 Tax=Pleurostoma richardsiae TaxID=41990 RepID=A0AA38VJA6_9PEZI|nr:hypothetical protein NKR23_g9702 [Pleurostoma richardsiae]
MPPPSHDLDLSLRFKHGLHTIFLFVDPTAPFSVVTTELLEVLRERYPEGLTRCLSPYKITPVPPAGADVRVSYAVLINPYDASDGWTDLKIQGRETPLQKGLKDNTIVAFAIQDPDDETVPEWVVQWPKLDDDEDEEDKRGDENEDEDSWSGGVVSRSEFGLHFADSQPRSMIFMEELASGGRHDAMDNSLKSWTMR